MEFKKVQLSDLGKIVTGNTPPTSNPEYFGEEYPFITPKDMHDRKNVNTTERYLSKNGAEFLKSKLLPAESIAVSCIGWQMGKAVKTTQPSFTNQQLNSIIPNEEVDADYLYYLLTTKREELFSIGSAAGVRTPILNKTLFSEFKVLVPSVEDQQKIASTLSSFDDLIENNTRRIEILEEMARRIYREWFVHFRYPGHTEDELVDSGTDLGEIPEGWSAVELGDVLDINKGKNITKKTTNPGNVPVVAGGLTPAYTHDTPNTNHPVITVSASGANAGYVNLYEVDVWASDCSYIDLNATSNIYYFYSLMKENQDRIFHMQHGSAQPHVYPKDLNRLLVTDPINGIKKEFEELINPIFSQRKTLIKKNKKLKETRDLLLPKLISGEIEVQREQSYDFEKN